MNEVYGKLYNHALTGNADCGGLISFNYISGEPVRAYSFLSVRSNTEPPARVLENLAKYLPNLNATWLLTGEGEMIQDKSTPEMPITLVSVNEYKSRLQQMEVRLEALRAQVVLKDKLLAGLLRKVENKTK